MEEWKLIPGFEGFECNKNGEIRNTKNGKKQSAYGLHFSYL